MKYQIDEKGFYGDFGGAYIPEMLFPNVEELRKNYIQISESKSFQKEFQSLLKDYVDAQHHCILRSVYLKNTIPRYTLKERICVIQVPTKSIIPLGKFC